MLNLKKALLAEYGTFAGKRIKKLERGTMFIVDDRGPGDVGGDRQLYPWFCMMFLEVLDADNVRLTLHNVPTGKPVSMWATDNGFSIDNKRLGLTITQGTTAILRSLAMALRSIVAPGAPRYSEASYKYVCPRTAKSLERAASALDRAWS